MELKARKLQNDTMAFAAVVVSLGIAPALAAEPFDAAGDAGATSYVALPFETSVYQNSWGAQDGLEPMQLFFQANPTSIFKSASTMATARQVAAAIEASGAVPSSGVQRWEDTYAASFAPGTFSSASASVLSGDLGEGFYSKPEFVAWRNFITSRPQYWDMAYDGGTVPTEAYYRSWGGQWGHISPLTPLQVADCPPGMSSCTWGDLWAYKWSLTSAVSGGYALTLSDFTDSQPDRPSTFQDFNPMIIKAFAAAYPNVSIRGSTMPAQADWIVRNAFVSWNDFLSKGYGKFYAAIAARVGAATSRTALVIDQCMTTPSFRRMQGNDERIIAKQISTKSYMCTWDDHIIQSDRLGPVVLPPVGELAGFIIGAAREPRLRNGANLEADDPAYWQAIAQFYPGLNQATQQELGYKLLKRLWIWSAWAHIADRAGNVRRALAYVTRDYWDEGSLTALDPLTSLIQTVVPTRPFGPALYYSTTVERAVEQQGGAAYGAGSSPPVYVAQADLQSYIDGGGPLGYYVSDAALPLIRKGAPNAPSAWVVIGGAAVLPAAEQQALTAVAPIVSSPAAYDALSGQSLILPAGMAGFGFYDQSGRLILVVSNPGTAPGAGSVSGVVQLPSWGSARAEVTDLFKVTSSRVIPAASALSIPVSVARWDTTVLAITPTH